MLHKTSQFYACDWYETCAQLFQSQFKAIDVKHEFESVLK